MKRTGTGGLLAAVCLLLAGCGQTEEVVVYTAVEQVYCQELFVQFEEETGIHLSFRSFIHSPSHFPCIVINNFQKILKI